MACGDQTVDIGACDVSGTNNTGMNSNYVVQYPKPYRRTDGKWLALANIVGAVIAMQRNKDTVKKANNAEKTWNDITDTIKQRGDWLIEYADKLTACSDTLHEQLCQLAICGYTPDYDGIMRRAKTIARNSAEITKRKLCREGNRYNTGMNANLLFDLEQAAIIAETTAINTATENLREKAFEINYKLKRQTTQDIEDDMLNRLDMGIKYIGTAANSYRDLAASYRQTAEAEAGDWTSLATTLAVLFGVLFQSWDTRDPENECGTTTTPPTGG